jgi:6-phosphogluconolactonase
MKIARRFFALLMVVFAPFLLVSSVGTHEKPSAKGQYLAYVGTYTTKTNSKGIYAFRYDASTGLLSPIGVAAETPDPSFLVIHPSGKYLYAVNEAGKNSMVSAFALDAHSGKLTPLNQLPALGEDPCYISFDKTGKYVFVANYTSGNIAVFPIGPDGRLREHTALVTDSGTTGPNKERQEGPHAHWIETSPDNRFVLVADLGLDQVLLYKFDAANGSLMANAPAFAKLKPGSGPRHIAFHPNGKFVFVVSELSSTATTFRYDAKKGSLKEIGSVSTLPSNFSGRNDVAELAVHPNGKFLYVSNRGRDSIAILSIDGSTGALTSIGGTPTGGKEPRHFAIDPTGKYLLAENQLSDSILTFKIDPVTGELWQAALDVSVPSPVDVAFVGAQ